MKIFEYSSSKAEGWEESLKTSLLFRIGVEYEVESVKQVKEDLLVDRGVSITKDGSLRNGGLEFITQPESKIVSLLTFKRLFENIALGPDPFTSRTSIHIHMNVAAMEDKHFLSLLYTYAALEPVFFNYVGKERQHNIHCVPLSDTYLSKYYRSKSVEALVNKWSKYTALNIKPVTTQGSIEFRHMFGTNDYSKFLSWVEMIEKLYNYALDNDHAALKNFWLKGGTGKQLETEVFGKSSSLTEKDLRVSVMESKSAFR